MEISKILTNWGAVYQYIGGGGSKHRKYYLFTARVRTREKLCAMKGESADEGEIEG